MSATKKSAWRPHPGHSEETADRIRAYLAGSAVFDTTRAVVHLVFSGRDSFNVRQAIFSTQSTTAAAK